MVGLAIADGKAFELSSGPVKKKSRGNKWQSSKLSAVYSMLSASVNIKILKHHHFFHRLRCMIHWIVTKKIFDLFIMFVIVLSSLALASEDPVQENSEHNKILGFADYWFTAIFTLECSLKVHQKLLLQHSSTPNTITYEKN